MPKEKGFLRPDEVPFEYGDPGMSPFRRGIHETMYRDADGRAWTPRLFAGQGTAPDTNKIFLMQLKDGSGGLSTAVDLPTLMGKDSDDPLSEGQVGVDGVAICTLSDMKELYENIPVDKITVSITINAPAAILLAMYIAMAEERGIRVEMLGGTLQNDPLKEYAAQKEYLWSEDWAMKLTIDTIEYAAKHMPKWHPISISGYHIREAGATAMQELAFTLASGIEYVRQALLRGLQLHEFVHRLSFFFDAHNNVVEEVAKLRAARVLWARIMKEKFGAVDPKLQKLKMHVQTAGCTLTREEPLNNIARVTIQTLIAILGGAQSIHSNSFDEVLCTPTEGARRIALRTQKILLEESGIREYPDLIGGSYTVEEKTNELIEQGWKEICKIEDMGGMLEAVKQGYPQRMIRQSAAAHEALIHSSKLKHAGVSSDELSYQEPENVIEELKKRRDFEKRQTERLRLVKENRDDALVQSALEALKVAAPDKNKNLMPFLIEAVKACATIGEICAVLTHVWGEYKEREFFMPSIPNADDLQRIECYKPKRPWRILLAKGGLDGHDRAIYPLAIFLKHMGYEVIYPALHCSMAEIAKRAMEEDVHVVGLSIHIGSPVVLFERLRAELDAVGWEGPIVGGGIIREHEREALLDFGVSFFASPRTSYKDLAKGLFETVGAKKSSVIYSNHSRHNVLSRLLTAVSENCGDPVPHFETRRGHVIGVTGLFAAGKSTLIDQVISVLRQDNHSVVVLAIDPSEEESGGAFLGDVIRMRRHYVDPQVFLRSISSRGARESLTKTLPALIQVAAYFSDFVIVETMGASQVDASLGGAVDTFITLAPMGGDIINLSKEGFHRHGHLIVANPRTHEEEQSAKVLRALVETFPARQGFKSRMFSVNAKTGTGVSEMVRNGVYAHMEFLGKTTIW